MNAKENMKISIMKAKGLVKAELKENQQQCPNCGGVYELEMPRGQGTPTQREQHQTGICSDQCWDEFLG